MSESDRTKPKSACASDTNPRFLQVYQRDVIRHRGRHRSLGVRRRRRPCGDAGSAATAKEHASDERAIALFEEGNGRRLAQWPPI